MRARPGDRDPRKGHETQIRQAALDQRGSHWDEVSLVWIAIEHGDAQLSVPAYDGGLFTSDAAVSRGAELARIKLSNVSFSRRCAISC